MPDLQSPAILACAPPLPTAQIRPKLVSAGHWASFAAFVMLLRVYVCRRHEASTLAPQL